MRIARVVALIAQQKEATLKQSQLELHGAALSGVSVLCCVAAAGGASERDIFSLYYSCVRM